MKLLREMEAKLINHEQRLICWDYIEELKISVSGKSKTEIEDQFIRHIHVNKTFMMGLIETAVLKRQ
jgi:hypothetical protein